MVILLAAGAAFLAASAVVIQRVALESAPHDSLSPRLMAFALRKRAWLIGFGLLLGVFALQASALHRGQLSVVQPVLTTELIFLVAILVVGFHRTVGWREGFGVMAIVAGLGAFFLSAAPTAGRGQPTTQAWVVIAVVVGGSAIALVLAGRTGPRWWRAAVLGSAAAVLFALTAALTKTVTTVLRQGGWASVFSSWEVYVLAVTGTVGLFLLQSALHAGPITASRTTNVIVNPLVSVLIGVTAFDEHIRSGTGWILMDVAAFAVLCAGVVVLVRSPLVAGLGETDTSEYLGARPSRPPAA
jgi:drug/metabolite transporter (DMT)-like permease